MNNETNINNWLEDEEKELSSKSHNFEQLPAFKLTPNVVTEISIDFSKPFEKWIDDDRKVTKKIIPVTSNGIRYNWWLNVKNPFYSEVIKLGLSGMSICKVMQVGTKDETKYVLAK